MGKPRSILSRGLLAAGLLAFVGVAIALFVPMPSGGSSKTIARRVADAVTAAGENGQSFAVPDWLSAQVLGLVNSKLRPQLQFASLEYAPPFKITLKDASLVTPEGERIVEVGTLKITLAERPKEGEPLRFKSVSLDDGVVRLIVLDGGGADAGGLAGFSRMMRDDDAPRTKQDAESGSGTSFSDALELRDVDITRFAVEYDGAGDGPKIRLDDINATMDIAPSGDQSQSSGKGWYAIDFSSGRAPAFELAIKGRLNLDTLDAEVGRFSASIDADPETIPTLPDTLAALLTSHDVRGTIHAEGDASANLRDLTAATANFSLDGKSVNATFGEYRLPLDDLRVNTTLSGGTLDLNPFTANIHGGEVRVAGASRLNEPGMPFDAEWSIREVELSEFLKSEGTSGDSPPKIAGLTSGSGSASSRLASLKDALAGTGSVQVKQGRLLAIPGLTQLIQLVTKKDANNEDRTLNHRGLAEFTLDASGARITKSEVVTNLIASRGTGTVGFDRTLDLRINAGPMEKIQSLLGPIGNLFGKVTDRLLKYTIKGTFQEPKVGVAPLGID